MCVVVSSQRLCLLVIWASFFNLTPTRGGGKRETVVLRNEKTRRQREKGFSAFNENAIIQMREDPWKSPFTDFPCSVCLSVFLQASKLGNFNPIAEAEEDEKPIKHFTSLRTAVLDVHWSLYGRISFRQLFAYLFIFFLDRCTVVSPSDTFQSLLIQFQLDCQRLTDTTCMANSGSWAAACLLI